jgi:membrane-bound lytic murein transglycosylase MltF
MHSRFWRGTALEIVYYLRKMLTFRLRSPVVATCILHAVTLSPIGSAQLQKKKPAVAAPSTQAEHWTGDLDGMLKRRTIRVVVSYSKTQYYVLKGVQYGISYEGGRAFEKYINQKYPRETKNLSLHVVFRPVQRDELFSHLTDGTADIAIAGLTITSERRNIIDFSDPMISGINEIVVTGPDSPVLTSLDDLSGKDIVLRKSSSYWAHVERLNERFKTENKAPVKLHAAPEDLEDEDLLEMVNAGLISTIVVDDNLAKLWSKLLTKLQLHEEISVNANGECGWAVRQNTQVGDIRQLEPNINAGVKYIRFMVDEYFADEPMDDLNKILFAFAAYNAGPGRVGQLRKQAAAQGLNPNVWTENVEMVAAARIGPQTVTYVSNIYKYYVAYKLLAEREAERQKARESIKQ